MKKGMEWFGRMGKRQIVWLAVSLAASLLILVVRPLQMTPRQAWIVATLLLALIWWAAGCVKKWITSLVLLAAFALFSDTPLGSIFQFPLSTNFLVIFFAFLFSQAISNSDLTQRLLLPLLRRSIRSVGRFLIFVMLCNIAFIFVIPQPFARVILLAYIMGEYLDQACTSKQAREVLMFSVYSLSITANMMFLRGDIIMNYAVLSFAELSLTEVQWISALTVPTLFLLVAEALLLRLTFRRSLQDAAFQTPAREAPRADISTKGKGQLAAILLTVVLLATESIHGLSGWCILLAGTVALMLLGLLRLEDLKYVNYELLVFFTAAFSIGPVMKSSGVADLIFSRFIALFPSEFGPVYLLLVVAITMVLHMILGSSVTTTSVVVPGILLIAKGVAPAVPLVLAIYVAVYAHYLMPIHNVVLMLGNQDYGNGIVSRFGLVMTVLIPVWILLVYYFWWQVIGIL